MAGAGEGAGTGLKVLVAGVGEGTGVGLKVIAAGEASFSGRSWHEIFDCKGGMVHAGGQVV